MAGRKKTAAELRAENRLLRRMRLASNFTTIATHIITWLGAVIIMRYCYKTVEVLAGQTTVADIGIKILGELRLSEAVAWIFGGSGIFYGLRQAKLRKDTIQRLQGRITALETRIDPGRSSSRLTERGETSGDDL